MTGWLATICAAIWALCCAFFLLVERPGFNTEQNKDLLYWYHWLSTKGTPFMIGCVFTGSALGIYAWLQNGPRAFLIGALILVVMFPLSSIFVVTDDREAMETETDVYGEHMKQVFQRWRFVHLLRTVLAFVALGLYLSAVLS